MHDHVESHWMYLNSLTGYNCLLLVVENIERNEPISAFKPADIYDIARHLGAAVSDVPAMIFFTKPEELTNTLILRLSPFLPESEKLTDEALTAFFRTVASITDSCATRPVEQRMQCLRDGLDREWPQGSLWEQLGTGAHWLASSAAIGATIVQSIATIAIQMGWLRR